jgi:cytochrome c-type biogenesis protein CcmH/NrfF
MMAMPGALPLAHAGHWVGLLYVVPILVVIAGIALRARAERKRERDEMEEGKSS